MDGRKPVTRRSRARISRGPCRHRCGDDGARRSASPENRLPQANGLRSVSGPSHGLNFSRFALDDSGTRHGVSAQHFQMVGVFLRIRCERQVAILLRLRVAFQPFLEPVIAPRQLRHLEMLINQARGKARIKLERAFQGQARTAVFPALAAQVSALQRIDFLVDDAEVEPE